ncbi:MAG: nucleoside phosphorylase [Desulfobacterales bacterium]|nr:nucleoside phosphorylase [Desulfobacterales bacterium]
MISPTWSDPNNPPIVPPLGDRRAPDLGPVGVLVSTEPDLKLFRSGLTCKAENIRPKDHGFFLGSLMTEANHYPGISVAGPYIGAPLGVMLLESLIARGAREIFILGWCGGLSEELAPGDLLVPDRALVEEGTSASYQRLDENLPVTRPDPGLSHVLGDHLKGRGQHVHRHPIWTTDAIYRETRDKVDYFQDRGAQAVEMECSALFAAAQHRNVPATALLVVSDSLARDKWAPAFRKKAFKTARIEACNALLTLAKQRAAALQA